jgi:ribokinase
MILVFSSINVDVLVPVPHLPQRGETVLGGDYRLLPGGKGANQALAACRAGAAVALAGAVGTDAFAGVALALLRRDGVALGLVRRVERPTGCAVVIVAETAENAIAVASGANSLVAAAQVPDGEIARETLLVAQMEVPPEETARMIRRVRERQGRVVLNLAPALPLDPDLLPAIDILVANELEAAALAGEPAAIASRLRQALVVTHSARGASAFLADGTRLEVPALTITAVDSTGAGDAFVGVLAAALDAGLPLAAALRRASVAGGLACLAAGAQSALPDVAAIDRAVATLPD